MLTPRRASWVVACLCAAAVGATLAATALSARARPVASGAPPDLFDPLRIAKIDVHQHVAPGTLDVALDVAGAHGIGTLVNLSGGAAGSGLEGQLSAAAAHPDRVLVFMNLDVDGCCDAAWASREAARLARGKALGARGLAIDDPAGRAPANTEPARRGAASGEGVPLDTPQLQPIWDASASLALPVMVHRRDVAPSSDPSAGTDELIGVVEGNPRVLFVAAHFGDGADDPAYVARLMDRLPNLWVDVAGRVPRLGRTPDATRSAILSHPDRVLFGSDVRYVTDGIQRGIVLGSGEPILLDRLLGGRDRRIFFEEAFRFLETRDRDIPSPTGGEGGWSIQGIGLPRAALERVYHRNAERLLGLRHEEAGR